MSDHSQHGRAPRQSLSLLAHFYVRLCIRLMSVSGSPAIVGIGAWRG
jgi:hypothetical protein